MHPPYSRPPAAVSLRLDGGRREDRKVGVAARGAIEADLLIPNGCKLTVQETWWRTMREVVKSSSEDRTATLEAGRGPKFAGVIVRVKERNTFRQRDPRKLRADINVHVGG
jgi:hypothetical protein